MKSKNRRCWQTAKLLNFLLPLVLLILSSCATVNDITIKSIDNMKFKGLKQNRVLLSLDISIDNPNNRKISITNVEFKIWMNARELGTFRTTDQIKLIPCSRQPYTVPVEIELITIADAFRIVTAGTINYFFDKIEVEGFIKGKSFPVRKKIYIERQPFKNLTSTI